MARGGKREGAGRKKGVPNKLTTDIKQVILEAFEELGGVGYLVDVAKENPTVFCNLVGRIIPKEVQAEVTVKTHEEMLKELE